MATPTNADGFYELPLTPLEYHLCWTRNSASRCVPMRVPEAATVRFDVVAGDLGGTVWAQALCN